MLSVKAINSTEYRKNNVISFGNKVRYNSLKKILENDSIQQVPVVLGVKSGFLEKAVKFITSKNIVTAGIAGESNSGKTTITRQIADTIKKLAGEDAVSIVSTDNYYNDFSDLVKKSGGFLQALQSGYSLDVPQAFNLSQLRQDISKLKQGKPVRIPEYLINDTGISTPEAIPIKPSKIVVSEGIFNLSPPVKDIFDLKIYIDVPPEEIKRRWYKRAGKNPLDQREEEHFHFLDVVKKADTHIRPTKKFADIILNGQAHFENIQKFVENVYKAIKTS